MILNRQRTVAISLAPLERFWQLVRRELRLPEDSVTICLVSNAQIARWNRIYRVKSKPTDVLSFPAAEESRTHRATRRRRAAKNGRQPKVGGRAATIYLGDIAIAPAVARRNARRLGRGLDDELRILLLHGALHLLGYDHERDHGEMDRIERRLQRRFGLEVGGGAAKGAKR